MAAAPGAAPGADLEETTYTGRIQLVRGELPVLRAEGQEYTLRINPLLASEIQVRDDDTVTVKGVLREVASFDLISNERILHVHSIEIGGTRYVSPPMMMGAHRHSEVHQRGGFHRHWSDTRNPRDTRGSSMPGRRGR